MSRGPYRRKQKVSDIYTRVDMDPEQLRRAFDLLGTSRERLADAMGLTYSTVNALLSGSSKRAVNQHAFRWVFMSEMIKRPCPQCGGPLCALRSLDKLICSDCKHEISWTLAPGQRPLVGSNRQDRGSKP